MTCVCVCVHHSVYEVHHTCRAVITLRVQPLDHLIHLPALELLRARLPAQVI